MIKNKQYIYLLFSHTVSMLDKAKVTMRLPELMLHHLIVNKVAVLDHEAV